MPTRTKRLAIILAFLCFLLATSGTIRILQRLGKGTDKTAIQTRKELADMTQNTGIMSKQEYLKREQIIADIKQQHSISDSDLSWSLQMLKTPAPSNDPEVQNLRRLNMMLVLKRVHYYTPRQEEEVYTSIIGFISSNVTGDRLGSIAVLRRLKDSRAIPYLTPLTSDPDPAIQRQVRRAIQEINEQNNTSVPTG